MPSFSSSSRRAWLSGASPVGGQDQSATGFSQYRRADLLLEFLQLSADGRRRPTEAIRRFGKTVELHAPVTGAQYVEVEGWAAHEMVRNSG